MYAVILAGGEGTRLWPLSRPDRPKPFLPLLGSHSLLQRTVSRIEPLVAPSDVFVVTDRRYAELAAAQLPAVPADNVLGEPIGRNTAAAIALAGAAIERPDDEVMLVLPADHEVLDEPGFRAALAGAAALASEDWLVTLGIEPTGPETGYGYILARRAAPGSEQSVGTTTAEGSALRGLEVERFVEKPDLRGAEALLATGGASWNSGIFVWTRRAICQALARHAADIVGPIEEAVAAAGRPSAPGWDEALAAAYPALRSRSIDYAVMEPASLEGAVRVVPIDVGWSDLGSWSALRDAWIAEDARARGDEEAIGLEADKLPPGHHVVGSGNRWDIDSRRCLVVAGERLVVTLGLTDTIVVDTPDALLVCAADRSQDVRRVAQELADAARAAGDVPQPPARQR